MTSRIFWFKGLTYFWNVVLTIFLILFFRISHWTQESKRNSAFLSAFSTKNHSRRFSCKRNSKRIENQWKIVNSSVSNKKWISTQTSWPLWPSLLWLRPNKCITSTGTKPTQCSGWTTLTTLLRSTGATCHGSMTRSTSSAQFLSLEWSFRSVTSSTVLVARNLILAASPTLNPRLLPSAINPTGSCTSPSPSDHSLQLLVVWSSIPDRITTSSRRRQTTISTVALEEVVPPTTWRWSLRLLTTDPLRITATSMHQG